MPGCTGSVSKANELAKHTEGAVVTRVGLGERIQKFWFPLWLEQQPSHTIVREEKNIHSLWKWIIVHHPVPYAVPPIALPLGIPVHRCRDTPVCVHTCLGFWFYIFILCPTGSYIPVFKESRLPFQFSVHFDCVVMSQAHAGHWNLKNECSSWPTVDDILLKSNPKEIL